MQIAYNSCRNRHCPKCQARAARRWLEARQVDLLPVDYYHLVFTLPAPISANPDFDGNEARVPRIAAWQLEVTDPCMVQSMHGFFFLR